MKNVKMGTMDARTLDSHLYQDSGVVAARQFKPAQSSTIQVQGHTPVKANEGRRSPNGHNEDAKRN